MSRIPLDVIEIEYGEDARYSPPTGADRWTAFRRTDIMPAMSEAGFANPNITYGGEPPTWAIMGGFDIAVGQYIPLPEFTGSITAPATGFEHAASATGFYIEWHTLASATASGLREVLMAIAYQNGLATHKTIFRVPAASAIDPTVIAAQERRQLMSLLQVRDKRAGAGGIIKQDHGEGAGEEFESLAVLDRRIAECRARIAWFEQAAQGNDLPGAAWAGLTAGTAARNIPPSTRAHVQENRGMTIMRGAHTTHPPFQDSDFIFAGTADRMMVIPAVPQGSSFAFWLPAALMNEVVQFADLNPGDPGTVSLADFMLAEDYEFGGTAGMLRRTSTLYNEQVYALFGYRAVLRSR